MRTPAGARGAPPACSARRRTDERDDRSDGALRARCGRTVRGARALPSRDRQRARGDRGTGDALCHAGELPVEDPAGCAGHRAADGRPRPAGDQAERRPQRDPRRPPDDRYQPCGPDRRGLPPGAAMNPGGVPHAVYVIWWAGLLVTLVVFVPLAVYLLHRTWRSARSIQRYAAETLQAAGGIARNTANIAALDTTIAVAGDMLAAAGSAERKLDTVASVLEERAR